MITSTRTIRLGVITNLLKESKDSRVVRAKYNLDEWISATKSMIE